jgi:hypothetical protein
MATTFQTPDKGIDRRRIALFADAPSQGGRRRAGFSPISIYGTITNSVMRDAGSPEFVGNWAARRY